MTNYKFGDGIRGMARYRNLQTQRYVNASHEEKKQIKEEWGIITNPTNEQMNHRRYWCELSSKFKSCAYGTLAGIITSVSTGFATLFYINPDPESLEGLLPAAIATATYGGVMYSSAKIGSIFHRRKHPTGRECNEEYVQRGLELIAELESRD